MVCTSVSSQDRPPGNEGLGRRGRLRRWGIGMGVSLLLGLDQKAAYSQPTLPTALDAPALVWITGGNAPWIGQTSDTHDGVDAARSGTIGGGEDSWLQTSVSGVTNISFWWRVSSEEGFDELEFQVDETIPAAISGPAVPWEQKSFQLDPGSHVLRWRYYKDADTSEGSDCGWLDQIEFTTIPPSPPVFLVQPGHQTVGEGADAWLTANVSGFPFPTYQWRFNDMPLAGATNVSLFLPNLSPTCAGQYTLVASNALQVVTSAVARLTVLTLAEGLDATHLVWVTGGVRSWHAEVASMHDGVDGTQSGGVSHSQDSWMQTSVSGPGSLTFWWKVSSESNRFGGDKLEFAINGVVRSNILGQMNWQPQAYALADGVHTLRWRYVKDGSFDEGEDRGWVDEVRWVAPPKPFNLGALSPQPDGAIRLTLFGERWRSYKIQTSTNLLTWKDLTGYFASTTNVMSVLDHQTKDQSRRFYRAAAWTGGPLPFQLRLTPQAGGAVWVTLFGEFGRTYKLQASGDLDAWNDLTSFSTGETNVVTILDSWATNAVRRFYRGIAPQQ